MDGTVRALMGRYGQRVEVLKGEKTLPLQAFLQPITRQSGEEKQYLPTSLGLRREDRWLYLGEGEISLSPLEDRVRWRGKTFEIQAAQPIYIGDRLSHWWAILIPEDKEAT